MKNSFLHVVFLLLAMHSANAFETGDMLVMIDDSKLVVIHSDGVQEPITEGARSAVFSPDRRSVVFALDRKLAVMALATHTTVEVAQLGEGAHFGQVAWAPDGNAIAYEAIVPNKSNDLFLAPFPPQRGQARNLGHWYQGFSFSPDGSRIVHAINNPFALEVLDLATAKRTLLHKADNVVWEAQFSPDGKFIAYTKTVTEPQSSNQPGKDDDEPDCANPPIDLHLYSLADGSDTAVTFHNLKTPDTVYHFSWSPDSRRIVLELGTNDCGYPSGDAAVFVTSVDQKYQVCISTASPAIEPRFSPDGTAVVFVDYSRPPHPMLRYEFRSRTLKRLDRPGGHEEYRLMDWK